MAEKLDPKEHVLVPECRTLSEEEEEELLESLGVAKKKLPKIQESDPLLKGEDVKVGDIIEIKRSSPTASKTRYYRVVVPEPTA